MNTSQILRSTTELSIKDISMKYERRESRTGMLKMLHFTVPASKHLPLEFIKNNVVVCDGGESVSTISDKIHTDKKHTYSPDIKFRFMGC